MASMLLDSKNKYLYSNKLHYNKKKKKKKRKKKLVVKSKFFNCNKEYIRNKRRERLAYLVSNSSKKDSK